MTAFGWVGFGVLTWLVLGLLTVRLASAFGHIWGFHFRGPIVGRAAVVLQAPALVLECAVMDTAHPGAEPLSVAAVWLMRQKFKSPQVDIDTHLERRPEAQAVRPQLHTVQVHRLGANMNFRPANEAAQSLDNPRR